MTTVVACDLCGAVIILPSLNSYKQIDDISSLANPKYVLVVFSRNTSFVVGYLGAVYSTWDTYVIICNEYFYDKRSQPLFGTIYVDNRGYIESGRYTFNSTGQVTDLITGSVSKGNEI